ncbi:hypothetical protein [Olleya sp. HaHaR_3_96]|uniref:hypothetical protein n=1 Tax=Olleya sp. HaHaR_3_96 TaxID=2745560 RepID=UPI001C4EA744|nr:hypothetical protein [Olleya sp. HaHaR_3_96]QXP60839.1 hypothetical protein H0I26_04160 [Olleya sp. HaHaR_3_96]
MNEQLLKDIKHFEYVTKNRYEIMENLLKKGYSENEIKTEFDNYAFKSEWRGTILGVIMVALAIFIGFSIKGTFGSFNYRFRSSGDIFRLNEWVFKPFLMITLLFIGTNTIINRGYINKHVKTIIIILFVLFLMTSMTANSPVSLLFAIIGIITFSLYKIASDTPFSSAQLLINAIKSGQENPKSILKKIKENDVKRWKGSSVIIFLLLAFCLLLNSPIDITREIASQTQNSTSYRSNIQNIDHILLYGIKTLLTLSFVVSIFLSINLKKFKILLFAIIIIALAYTVTTFFHSNPQVSIYPALIIVISGSVTVMTNTLLSTKSKTNN